MTASLPAIVLRCGSILLFAVGYAVVARADAPAATPSATAEAEQLFLRHIQPLFVEQCQGCHAGREEDESTLDLRSRAGLLAGGESGQSVIVPGDALASRLYQALTWNDPQLLMPPKEANRFTEQQLAWVRQWIAAGAPWPDRQPAPADGWDAAEGIVVPTSGGLTNDWTQRRYQPDDVWAFQPVRSVAVPVVGWPDGRRPEQPVDAFLEARLLEAGLPPAAPAPRAALIRRVTFDLLGLPPTPDEVAAFVNDDAPDAWERLIDRLLASPHYGERWGRHWLDVVRYADTAGFANDYPRPNAWRYRDYVIRSFNDDKPFDRFILEQVAGDELDPADPDCQIAVGFLRMGPWEHTGMSVAAVTRQMFLDDVTDTVGQTFLALGLRCASCHDHKFDPIPTRDYYHLQAVFAAARFAEREVPFLAGENRSDFEIERRRTEAQLAETQAGLAALRVKQEAALAAFLEERGVTSVEELPLDQRPALRRFGLSPDELGMEKVYRKRLQILELEQQRYLPQAMSLTSPAGGKQPPDEVFILAGGSLESPGERVGPAVLSALRAGDGSPAAASISDAPQGRRLALARWLAHADNPLTARVMVNRIWQHHFGRGLVETSNNFGRMGKRPTHPELLDWLAGYFVEHGWSVKQMHRLLLTSQAYQRSSRQAAPQRAAQIDPENHLLAAFRPRRLSAEELRDGMLAVAGLLSPGQGGLPTYPEINQEAALQPRHIMGNMAPAYVPSLLPEQRHRRTIYTVQIRGLVNPLLEVFNLPGSELPCEARDQTTVAPQVFALFNGQPAHDVALAFGQRLLQAADDDRRRVELAFQLCYGRAPGPPELELALSHLDRMTAHHRRHPAQAVEMPRQVLRVMVEELTGKPFEYVETFQLDGYQPDLKIWQVDPRGRAWADFCLVLLNSNEFVYIE